MPIINEDGYYGFDPNCIYSNEPDYFHLTSGIPKGQILISSSTIPYWGDPLNEKIAEQKKIDIIAPTKRLIDLD